ncbi:MAG: hypothetical protein IJU94_03905 [Clostridia bacterium]|nr:hypothetical protein [Clostridia bacterium]
MAEKRSKAGIISWIAVALIIAALAAFCVWLFLSPWVYHRDMVITSFSAQDKNDLCACFGITVDDSAEFLRFEYHESFRETTYHMQIKVNSPAQARKTLSNYSKRDGQEKKSLSGKYFHTDEYRIGASVSAEKYYVIINFNADRFLSTETYNLMRGYTDRQIAASNYDEWQGM